MSWLPQTLEQARRMARMEQQKPMIERAAIALAAALFAGVVEQGEMRVAHYGDRVDYWLPRQQRALEISGTEVPSELLRRHQEKRIQLLNNSAGWNGYVVVCCFTQEERRILWSYHEQERSDHGGSIGG